MTFLAAYSCKWDSNSREEEVGARIISTQINCLEGIRIPVHSECLGEDSLFQHRLVQEISDSQDSEDLLSNNRLWILQVKVKLKASAEIKGTLKTEIKTKVQTISTIIDNLEENRTTLISIKNHLKLQQVRLNKKSKMLAGALSRSSWCQFSYGT